MLRKIALVAALLAAPPALAETVAPFPADDCNPGYTADGQFVDAQGRVFDQTGWQATSGNVVVDALGRRVLLSDECLARHVSNTQDDQTETGIGGTGAALGAVLAITLLATGLGGAGGTNGTN